MKRIDVNIREDQYGSLKRMIAKTFRTMSAVVRESLDMYFDTYPVDEGHIPRWFQDMLTMIDLMKPGIHDVQKRVEIFWDLDLLPVFESWSRARKVAISVCYHLRKSGVEAYEEDDIGTGKRDYIGIIFNFPNGIDIETLKAASDKMLERFKINNEEDKHRIGEV